MSTRNRSAWTRGCASLLATCTIFSSAVVASPGEMFSAAAPTIGGDPPKATELKDGDLSVSSQTGAAGYTYPIQVPAGRGGAAPSIALTYSSQAPTYGGIAAGWSLATGGIIREDTSLGRMRTHSPAVESTEADPRGDDRFISSLAGESQLVAVTEPKAADVYRTYRVARADTSFARYERMVPSASGPRWRVRQTDGSILQFGEAAAKCSAVSDGFAPLTSSRDVFGNEVRYEYDGVVDDCRLVKISWGYNAGAGFTTSFAQAVFTYAASTTCPNASPALVGAQLDYRTGVPIVTGGGKLTAITVTAFPPGASTTPEHSRVVTLGYSAADESCTAQHAPVRLLTSIQESAWGTNAPRVDLSPVTFTYGDPTVSLTTFSAPSSGNTPWGADARNYNLGWGYRYNNDDRWPTVEAMMIDIDGDGLIDRLMNNSTPGTGTGACQAKWQRNLGTPVGSTDPVFSGIAYINLPRLKWRGSAFPHPAAGAALADTQESGEREGCALNGQVTAFENSVDGTPGLCHSNAPCGPGSDPNNPGPYCAPGGTACPFGAGGAPGGTHFHTYLAYRWLDMDADGLVDLVAAVHGDIDRYDIEKGNRIGYDAGEPALFGPWPACPGSAAERCKNLSSDCMNDVRECLPGQDCTVDPKTMQVCMHQAEQLGCSVLTDDNTAPVPPGSNPQTPYTRGPYQRCEGLYPWFIYKNTGNGNFASTPVIKYQPVQLESDTGDSNLSGPSVVAQHHAIMDFDGDGVLDAVAQTRGTGGGASGYWWWAVWLGDGTGGFDLKRHLIPTRRYPSNQLSATSSNASGPAGTISSSQGVIDLNGDGLPDHWLRLDPGGNANVAFHAGTHYLLKGSATPRHPIGTVTTPVPIKPGNDASTQITDPPNWLPNQPILGGTSSTLNRTIDVDGDGRIDVARWGSPPQVHFNAGGQFLGSVSYPGDISGLRRHTVGSNNLPRLLWELRSDVLDLDGDGIGESLDTTSLFRRYMRSPLLPPPRLLVTVNNGRGAVATLTYASMHDKNVVEQHPEQTWAAGRPKASPEARWVVKSTTTHDNFAATDSTTSYFYVSPRHNQDLDGQFGFRGFEEVRQTSPSGATTINRYSYAPDYSGRLAETVSVEASASTHSIDRATWTERSLFGGAVRTYHTSRKEHFGCSKGATESTCRSGPAGYTTTTSTLTAFPSTTQAGAAGDVVWQETGSLIQLTSAPSDGDRQKLDTFATVSNATTYRFRPTGSTHQHRTAGAMTTFARSAATWDASYSAQLTDEVWVDNIDANRAITKRDYDFTTGNLTARTKPMQAASGARTTYGYDARKLYVATEVNEVGHQVDNLYDYGTGAKLETAGPNVRSCTTSCPSGPDYPIKETRRTRVDGLGRAIETYATIGDDGGQYHLYLTSTSAYVDTATATVPTSVSTTHVIQYQSPTTKQEKTELDGHGRPRRQIVLAQGDAPADQVTSFVYRNDGTLQSVSTPDPTANGAGLVTYTYTFDSLGRPTSLRRPDSTSAANQSGVNIAYDGMTKTISEVVLAGDGQPATTRSTDDAFGRLVKVEETTSASPLTWAATTYSYGPDDIVSRIVDPGGVTTNMTHDFAGHRLLITRHGRTWKYTYDKNGNMASEQAPGSLNAADDANYITTTVYDALDRPLSKVIGQRALSTVDQAAFASRTETFTWDSTTGNGRGRLINWKTFAPGASTPAVADKYTYDAAGNRIDTNEVLNTAGYTALQRASGQRFNFLGGVEWNYYKDSVGGTNSTQSNTIYDHRALPKKLYLIRTGEPTLTVADQTRNVSGLVTKRRTDTTGAMTFVEANWAYDKLGRVANQIVQKGPGPTQITAQALTYFGNDDPKTLAHSIGSVTKRFQYGYDLRHQLTSANETTTAGYLSSSYTYGAAGRLAGVNIAQPTPPPGSEVMPRNVTYVYGDADPERVTALTNVAGGTPFARYTYDAAGNQLSRCYGATCGAGSASFVYDGRDQLRRAVLTTNGATTGSEDYTYAGGVRTVVVKRDAAGAKTELTWTLGDTEAHYDPAGAATHVYSHLSMGSPVARVDRTANATTSLEMQFHGLANNTIAAVASTGVVTASMSYTPFGEVAESVTAQDHRRRFNDKQQDGTSLAYYGARYYDATQIGWTSSDPKYRMMPDANAVQPRRHSLYTFSLGNPLRYIDADGRDVASEARVPSAAELAQIVQDYVQYSEAAVAAYPREIEHSVLLVGVTRLAQRLNINVSGAELEVGDLPDGVDGRFNPQGFIRVRPDVAMAQDADEVLYLIMVLIHEATHSEQSGIRMLVGNMGENAAYDAQVRYLQALLANGTITQSQYDDQLAKVLASAATYNCAICEKSPYKFPDMASDLFRKKNRVYIETLWGLQVNPDGPAAKPR